MINLVREICERKRGKVHPDGATELELKYELSRQGVHYTAESFQQMCETLKHHPRITTYRTLNHTAYAYNPETAEESVSAEARDTGATHTREYPLLSEPAVAEGTQELPRSQPPMSGVSESGEDYTGDGSGSHHSDKYWWSEI